MPLGEPLSIRAPEMTKRIHSWGSALAAVVAERMRTPFVWGTHDCALWAADCVYAVTGEDPATDLRGTYSTAFEAVDVLQRLGGLEAIASARIGPQVNPKLAQVGDIAMCQVEGRDALAVVMGSHLLAPGESGLVPVPMSEARKVWRCTRAE